MDNVVLWFVSRDGGGGGWVLLFFLECVLLVLGVGGNKVRRDE